MRKERFGLFAGSVLAMTVAAPTLSVAAPLPLRAPAPVAKSHLTSHRPAETGGVDFKGALNKIIAASESRTAEKLRAILTSKALAKWIDRADERKDVAAFYAARNYAPLWIENGVLTERGKTTIARLKDASAEGLDPADYPVPELATGSSAEADADADIKLTGSVLDFARHLAVGRIAPTRVTAQVQYGNHTPDPGDILKKVSQAHDINAAFDSFDPPDRGFRALKAKLAELRAQSGDPAPNRIPDGPAIRPGAKDSRIPLLRARLGIKRRRRNDPTYRRALYNAIRRLQHKANLRPNGIIDRRTLALINGPTHAQIINTVLANMERWRWLPRDLGRSYVMVNIPDFTLKVVHERRVVWRTKIVVGKPQTPTPLLSASMDRIIVNPSWYVPQSIIQNELLPAYRTDPNIFNRMGLEVKRGPDGHINVVQPPGAANALGRIKFVFPNKFQVYLHDTPEKRLFSHSKRAFSHGCMRVEDPTKFGEIIMSLAMSGPTPNARQIRSLFGHDVRTFKLTERPMVYLTYRTAFVDDDGKLQLRDDIYGFDARIHAILTTDERRVADIAPPPDPKRDLDTERSNQEILSRVERREVLNPFAFFEKLFR